MIYSLPCTIFETARPYILYPLFQKHPSCWEYYTFLGLTQLSVACSTEAMESWTRLVNEVGVRVNMFISIQALIYSKVKLSSNEMIKVLDLSLSCSGEKYE